MTGLPKFWILASEREVDTVAASRSDILSVLAPLAGDTQSLESGNKQSEFFSLQMEYDINTLKQPYLNVMHQRIARSRSLTPPQVATELGSLHLIEYAIGYTE